MFLDMFPKPFRRAFPLVAAACILSLLSGCGGDAAPEAGGIAHGGAPIMGGALGNALPSALRFRVYGKTGTGPARSLPVSHERVAFSILKQPEGAGGASLSRSEAVSDAGGLVAVNFTVGDKPGVYQVAARLPGHSELAPALVTVVGGVIVDGTGRDGWIGTTLDGNLAVRLESAPGVFLGEGGGEVRFSLMGAPQGTTLSAHHRKTDAAGEAATEIRFGQRQGKVDVGITVLDGLPGDSARLDPIIVSFFAIDRWAVAVSLLGGLALFLFGMKTMSESLQFVAGEKLRDLLNMLTRNRFMAVGAGAMVTALIQSSSACTVMVVGFLNAGLMRLEQAIGVIMGANIGTTLTAQIISLKLSVIALPAVAVGVAILFAARRQTVKYWGSILVGFGILFLGMNIMGQELGDLRESGSVVSMFKGFDCVPGPDGNIPILQFLKAIGVGLAATLILQSSTATIGLLIAIAAAGLIDPYAAFGVLLGDNIGTTITAVLASIGTSPTAKRSACFHVIFNTLGVIIMIFLNYVQWPGHAGRPIFMELANQFTPGDVFKGGENLPRFLANSHTLFNVACTCLFLPFVSQFARLCRFVVRAARTGGEAAEPRRILEPHLLATPSIALQQAWTEVGVMIAKARDAQTDGYRALISAPVRDPQASGDTGEWNIMARSAKDLEKETDELKVAITKYLGGISLTTLNESQAETYPRLICTIDDAEKIADLGKHLSKLAKRVNKRSLSLAGEAVADMDRMFDLVDEMLTLAEKTVNVNADGIEISGGGAVLRRKLLADGKRLEKAAKAKATELRKNHEARHADGQYDIKSGVVFLDVAGALSRSAGCAFNIIRDASQISYHAVDIEEAAAMAANKRGAIGETPG